jgi:apolipoprotein N-acyltransferase
MVPFLVYLSITRGWKSKLLFSLALLVSWSIIVLKIITPPVPYVLIFLYSIPISLIHLPGYLIWSNYKERRFSVLLFPAMMVVLEWIQYTFTPLASWGVAAYTQANSIYILQFLSTFGMAGLSFLIYWVNLAIATLILKKERSIIAFKLPIATLCFVVFFGALRFEISNSKGVDTITVSAVGTDSEIGGLPLPPGSKNQRDIEEIFNRTRNAADFGAKIVVWNEAAFYLEPANESSWTKSFQQLAKEYGNIGADIVAVPASDWRGIDPLHTRMAAYRAIEQGHSVLRSTRFGLSAAINPFGKMTSQMSSFDSNNKIMISQLPIKGISTLYSIIGDILVYLSIVFIIFFLFKWKKDPINQPASE